MIGVGDLVEFLDLKEGEFTFEPDVELHDEPDFERIVDIEIVAAAAAAAMHDVPSWARDYAIADVARFADNGIDAGDFWIGYQNAVADAMALFECSDDGVSDEWSYACGYLGGEIYLAMLDDGSEQGVPHGDP